MTMKACEVFLGSNPVPAGIRTGDLIHLNRIAGTDMQTAFLNLQAAVQGAGGTLENVAQVSIFVKARDDLQAINPVWTQMFPDEHDRPTYKFMVAEQDPPVQLEAWAVAGARRRTLQIPNVAHTNPIPMGVRIGDMLFSARVLPYDPATGKPAEGPERQTGCLFHNVRALLDVGDIKPEYIVQGRLFLADPGYRPLAEQHWSNLVAGANESPVLHLTPYGQGTQLLVMLEVIPHVG